MISVYSVSDTYTYSHYTRNIVKVPIQKNFIIKLSDTLISIQVKINHLDMKITKQISQIVKLFERY